MNLIERMFPSWAIQRRQNLMMLHRLLEHDKTNRRHPSRKMGPHSGDAVMQISRHKIRESARWLEENHAAAVSIIETLVTNIVGNGTVVEPMVMNKAGELAIETNAELRRAWRDFMKVPEVTLDYQGGEFESQIVRSWVRDGEIFGQHIMRGSAYRFPTDLQYAVELIESDMVPFDMQDAEFTHGVRKDAWGRPIQYLVYKEHPGSATVSRASRIGETKTIPAESMFHLKWSTRVRQTRGLSLLHAVIDILLDLADYEDSERVAARVNASQVIAIKQAYAPPETTNTQGEREFKVGPASIWHLLPGEDISAIRADRPNPNLAPFVASQLRRAASGTMTSFSSISRDYSQGTFSTQRQELIETVRFYSRLTNIYHNEVVGVLYRKVLDEAMRVRNVPLVGVDTRTLFDVDLRGPGLIWIDPQKEADAAETDIRIGIRSRQQIIRERGGDPVQVTKELSTDEFEQKPTGPVKPAVRDDSDSGKPARAA